MDAKRDWGHAKDYVEMQWLMLQQEQPDDYVIATGIQKTVREFVEYSAQELKIDLVWEGNGEKERGIDAKTGTCIVAVDPSYYRPTEVETLLGDATKAKEKLGWVPKISFEKLVREMVVSDWKEAQKEATIKGMQYPKEDILLS